MVTGTITAPKEEIEGLDDSEDANWGDYPIDTLLIRNESRTVHDILRRIEQKSFVMDPEFQRDFIWPDDKQSKLVESVLLRIPLPVFYLAENDQGQMVVVDGLQRLSTFQRFVNNKLRLKLPDQKMLDKKRFNDLSPKLQNRIEDCNLTLYVIDAKVPERARLDIFERVNGGIPLTRQQMRNCIFMGQATRFLKDEVTTDLFKEVTGGSLNVNTMRDREFVNRFCAFKLLSLDDYRDMDEYLAIALRRMNTLNEIELNKLASEFRRSLENNQELFKEQAFRKHFAGQSWRGVINAALWDVMSTGLSRYSKTTVKAKASVFKAAFYGTLADGDFNTAISIGTNDIRRVKYRFKVANELFAEVFDD